MEGKVFKHGINIIAYSNWIKDGHLTTLKRHILSKYPLVTYPINGVPRIEGHTDYSGDGSFGMFALRKGNIWLIDVRESVVNSDSAKERCGEIMQEILKTDFENDGIICILLVTRHNNTRVSYNIPTCVDFYSLKSLVECTGTGYMCLPLPHNREALKFGMMGVESLI